MKRHLTKTDFSVIAITVISLEVLAFIVFILGAALVVYNMFLFPPLFTSIGIIVLILGVVITAFLLLATAEFLQLILKIEVNTRKGKK